MAQRFHGAGLENQVGDTAGASKSSQRGVIGGWGMALGLGWMGLGWMLAATSASAHSGVILLPPAGDYVIRWYQPHDVRPVDNWQIEVTRHRTPTAPFIANVQMGPDASCWDLNVPVNQPASVRVRSVDGTGVSAWSRNTSLPNADGYRISWYQSHARPVDDWDIEVATLANPGSPFISTALVMPNRECWGLAVPVTESANVRIRQVVGTVVAPWSPRTTVPEVGLGVGIPAAAALLGGLARRRRRRN